MMAELTTIPSGWNVKKLGEIGRIITGSTPKTSEKENWIGSLPFVSPTDIDGKKNVSLTERHVNKSVINKNRLIPKDSVLYTSIASIGKMAIANEECTTNQQINSIVPYADYDSNFLYYSLLYKTDYIKTLAGMTAVPIINKSLFSKIELNIPRLMEQQKIAAILSSVDEAIEKTEQIIEQTEKVKKGLMQELLTKGIGHTEFKDSEIGKIPKEWSLIEGKDLYLAVSGYSPSKLNFNSNGEILYFKVNDMNSNENRKHIKVSELSFNKEVNENINYYPKETIVFPKRGAAIFTNKIGILSKASTFDTNIMGLICKENINHEFLYYYLKHYGLFNISDNSGVPQLNNKHIYPLLIPVPEIKEQKEISNALNSLYEKKEIEIAKKSKLIDVKQGLMQELLTGKKRVKVDESEEVTI